jgi:hypothetical protein
MVDDPTRRPQCACIRMGGGGRHAGQHPPTADRWSDFAVALAKSRFGNGPHTLYLYVMCLHNKFACHEARSRARKPATRYGKASIDGDVGILRGRGRCHSVSQATDKRCIVVAVRRENGFIRGDR